MKNPVGDKDRAHDAPPVKMGSLNRSCLSRPNHSLMHRLLLTLRKGAHRAETIAGDEAFASPRTRTVQWSSILLFLFSSSILFVGLFEWDRYHVIAGRPTNNMFGPESIFLFWLLVAKSVVWFLPFLLIWGVFICPSRWRTSAFILNVLWILVFYFMAFDLVSVSFAGYHVWDYLPNVQDMLQNPGVKIWQWTGEKLTREAVSLLVLFIIFGPLCFFASRFTAAILVDALPWLMLRSVSTLTMASLALVAFSPALFFEVLPDRIQAALPYPPALRESCERINGNFKLALGLTEKASITDGFLPLGHAAAAPFTRLAPNGRFQDSTMVAGRRPLGPDEDELSLYGGPDMAGRLPDEVALTKLLRQELDPRPVDESAFVGRKELPNVILIIYESFRHSALNPQLMKELDGWSQKGLRLDRHYSGSNCSHLGLFSLLYGRAPLGYHKTLDRNIPAQMLRSLRASGYEITFLTCGETKGFRRLDRFINKQSCDNYILEGQFTLNSMKDWPDSDRRKLSHVQKIVNGANGKPQFVFFYLVSSHYRYSFPPEFDVNKEAPRIWEFLNPKAQIQNHLNRYANAMLFLEHEVMKLVRSLDLTKNLIIITGDHGESMGEDGVFTHGSRMSEIQMRVPFVMVGPGIEPRRIPTATVHMDVLPTVLHALGGKGITISNAHGRDLIGDPAPSDEVILVPANGLASDRVMIVRGEKRLIFRPATAKGKLPEMVFEGLADTSGHYEFKVDRAMKASRAVQ